MKLQTISPPEGGSLSVVYSCPECGYEMAMLTNPFETQLVQSLGVRIGPEGGMGAPNGAGAGTAAPVRDVRISGDDETVRVAAAPASRCPFAAMMPAMEDATPAGADPGKGRELSAGEARHVQSDEPISVRWTPAAEARLANIPAFVRPMARTGIERFAQERGVLEVDETILDAAREFFGM
jgi:hypothetical protein